MKKLFIAMLAVAAVTACAKDEPISVDRQAIGFGNPFVENSVRADYSASTIQQFNVYGTVNNVALFGGDGAVVSSDGNAYGVAWNCSEAEYWVPGANYVFEAVVDGAISSGTISFNVGDDVDNDGVSDLLYATETVTNAAADQGIVKFNFSHLLSKVGFKFTNGVTANDAYTFNVTGVSFTGHDTKGTYTISTGKWDETVSESSTDLSFGAAGAVAASAVNAPTTHQIIPGEQTLNVTVTYNIVYKGTTIKENVKVEKSLTHDFAKGNVYTIVVELPAPGQPIQFSVEETNGVDAWGNGGEQELE